MVSKAPRFVHRFVEATGRAAVAVNSGTVMHCITSTILNVKWKKMQEGNTTYRVYTVSTTHLLYIESKQHLKLPFSPQCLIL